MKKLKLLKLRTHKDLTQNEIAVLANMDQTTYGRKENGVSKITSKEWKKLANILDVPLIDIFEDDEKLDITSIDNCINSRTWGNRLDYSNILENLKNYIKNLEIENKSKDEKIWLLETKNSNHKQ
jgi:transcriptional regulator with XRE-family HTH domain